MLDVNAQSQNMKIRKSTRSKPEQMRVKRGRIFDYKIALLVHDLIILCSAAALGILPVIDDASSIFGVLVCGAVLFFLINLRLYSYHLIFSMRDHLFGLGKSFLYTFLTLAITITILRVPETVINTYLVPLTLICTIFTVFASRKFNADMLGIFYPVGLAFLFIGAIEILRNYFPFDEAVSWLPALRTLLYVLLLLATTRTIIVHWVFNVHLRKRFRRQVLIVGSNAEANGFAKHIFELNAPFWVVGTVSATSKPECQLTEVPNKACLGTLEHLPTIALQHHVREIVVTSETIQKHDLIDLLDYCTSTGINAWFSPSLMPIIDVKLHIDRFCGRPMIRLCSQKRSWLFYKIKYASDALITLPVFLLQLPLFLLLVALIKLDSKGPVFYVANAIGKSGSPFGMYKFRSMLVDSDKSLHQQYITKYIKGEIDENEKKNGPIKIVNDPRVTKIGRLLRKLSLDELPQLINVLKGQMSLVGPRPCLPYEYDIYQDWHKKRTAVRPGITGLWQVTGRSEVLFEDMILLDLYYIYNNSVMLDLQILFETVFVVLGKKGAF